MYQEPELVLQIESLLVLALALQTLEWALEFQMYELYFAPKLPWSI
jgi:hypothetical protein